MVPVTPLQPTRVLFFLCFLLGNPVCRAGTLPERKCIINPTDVCQKVTVLPNLLGMSSFDGVEQMLQSFDTIIAAGFDCARLMKAFMCSMLIPECRHGDPVPPCHDFCQASMTACQARFKELGMPTEPSQVLGMPTTCANFPTVGRCVRSPNNRTTPSTTAMTTKAAVTSSMATEKGEVEEDGSGKKDQPLGFKRLQKDVLTQQSANLKLEAELLKLQIKKIRLELEDSD